ncbi:MAG: YceI family protein [Deltaproteobacteria bacterium]|nr:YceI family protein [Deltaproteobacteria bacterium]
MKIKLFFLLISVSFFAIAGEKPVRFQVVPEESSVQFSSKAPLEDFVGKTKEISGWVEGNAGQLTKVQGTFSVNPVSLKTGNRLRDKDMREFLETDQFPEIRFTLKQIGGMKLLTPGQKGGVTAEGSFDLHGIKRTETIPLEVLYDPTKQELQISSTFPILLADYQIERPQVLWVKLAEKVTVTLQLVLRP